MAGSWQTTRKYNSIFLFFDSDACVEQDSSWWSLHTQRRYRELEQPVGTDFSQNPQPYIVFKTPTLPTWPYFFTQATLVFHLPWFTPMHCLFSGHQFLILSMAICQLYSPGSSQVKVIYYICCTQILMVIK